MSIYENSPLWRPTRHRGIELHYLAGGELRAAAALFLRQHYLGCDGNAGAMFAAVENGSRILGACLIGASPSANASRAIAGPGTEVRYVKRLLADDQSPVPESQLLRFSASAAATLLGIPLVLVSLADPAARNIDRDQPLLGWVYLASGFFYFGDTSSRRQCVVTGTGEWRSPRQGSSTISRGNLPPGWRLVSLPPARIWITVVPPPAMY